jgi:thermolysin metallopeptidase-like protein
VTRTAVCCLVPPHILSAIAVNGTKKSQRERALGTLAVSHTLAAGRIGFAEAQRTSRRDLFELPGRAVFRALVPGHVHRTIFTAKNTQGVPGAVVNGRGIRDMRAPGAAYGPDPVLGKDPQPSHMSNYVSTLQDSGGVHINSGIPNHAFYLTAVALGGHAWEKAGAIWYATTQSPLLHRMAQFHAFAQLTVTSAQQLYPRGTEAQIVAQSWNQVGISV